MISSHEVVSKSQDGFPRLILGMVVPIFLSCRLSFLQKAQWVLAFNFNFHGNCIVSQFVSETLWLEVRGSTGVNRGFLTSDLPFWLTFAPSMFEGFMFCNKCILYFTISSDWNKVMQNVRVEGSLNIVFHYGSMGMISSMLLSKASIDIISTSLLHYFHLLKWNHILWWKRVWPLFSFLLVSVLPAGTRWKWMDTNGHTLLWWISFCCSRGIQTSQSLHCLGWCA